MKSCKRKRFLIFLEVFTLCLTLIVSTTLIAFAAVTKNAKLDKTKLSSTNSSIVYVSANGDEAKNTSSNVTIESLNEYTINAFVAKEDKRFFSHHGYDIIRMMGALKNNIKSKEVVEGGSTITQQLVKNTHTSGERTLKRKLNELKIATELEDNYSKNEILEMYLNKIYFGNNCYGINEASKYYFNKSAANLSLAESAILSGLISAPSVYNPKTNLNQSKKMGKMVLSLMQKQGYITKEEQQTAEKEIDELKPSQTSDYVNQYLAYASKEALEILNLKSFDSNSNVVIVTHLDAAVQNKLASEIFNSSYLIENSNNISPDNCGCIIDNETGGIIAFAGKSEYDLTTLRRQPASTIKPVLVYAPAFEKLGYSPSTLILDEPVNYGGYTPHNATKLFYGYTSVRDSLIRSTNIPAVKTLNEIGIDYAKEFAGKMGITFNENDNNLALALGGFTDGVTATELAGAYACFARGGYYIKPHFVKEILINNISVYKENYAKQKVMSESTAYLMTNILKDVAARGTARKLNTLGNYIASKTGTNATETNNMDAVNVSYTTKHTAVCWFGNTSGADGSMNKKINGSTYPTIIVKNTFKEMYKNNTPDDFSVPSSVVTAKIDAYEYDTNHKIYLADENTEKTINEVFDIQNLPTKKESSIIIPNNETKLFINFMM